MRKIISIILLGCLFIYESGYMLLYVFQLLEVKQEMQAYIRNHPKEHGQFFTFQVKNGDVADKSFSWEEEPEEFSYKGRMYDVVDIKTSGDKLFIHAYNDQKEEQLQADLARHHKQKHNPALNQLISLVFIHPQNEAVSQDHTLNLVHTNITKTEKLHSVELAIQSPPPEIV